MATKKAKSKTEAKITEINIESIEQFIVDAGSDHAGVFGGTEGGIQCQQIADELAPCILAILESGEKIKSYLEIGAAAGGSAFIINYFLKPDRIVLVDDNQHWKCHVRPYVLQSIPYEEIIGNSHDQATAAKVGSPDVLFDLLMIDGDHYYEGVKADVKTYGEYLRPGGFLIFHDSQIGAPYGCYQVFQELKKDKRWELVAEYVSEKMKPCGVGLFRKAGK